MTYNAAMPLTPVLLNDYQVAFVALMLLCAILVCVVLTYQAFVWEPYRRSSMCDQWYDTQTNARALTVAARAPQGPIYDHRCGRYRDPVTKRFVKSPQFA